VINIIIKVLGVLILVSAVFWPVSHSTHECPPKDQWKDTICPQAAQKEAYMFLQIIISLYFLLK